MSGLLRPVGPEDPQVYWLRRAVVLVVVALVVLIVVAWLRPDPTPGQAVASPSSTMVTPGPTSTPTPTPKPTRTAGTASPKPSVKTTPKSSPARSATPKATPKAVPTATPAAADCTPGDVEVGIAGGGRVTAGKAVTFTVSLTNAGKSPCRLALSDSTFELKVYSGSDRIWSTADCADWFDEGKPSVVKAGGSRTAEVTWPARRSSGSCKLSGADLAAGTYVATAQLDGADPAQRVMGLR